MESPARRAHGLLHLDAIAELGDFRKVNGSSDSVFKGLTSTELYLKKVRKTVSKMMRLKELDIDALEAKGRTLSHAGRAHGSRQALLAALRKRAEIMQRCQVQYPR